MRVRSVLFTLGFWLTTFILGVGSLPIELFYRPFAITVARTWVRVTFWLLRVLCGITYEVRGLEHIPLGPALVACRHQSAWDTMVFWMLLAKPVFVLKRELIFIPVFGWQLLVLKSIYIDRKAGAGAMKRMLRQAQARAREGYGIVIFPEGTRTPPGANAPFHPGVAALYHHLGLPAVPVALNSGLHWGKNALLKTPGVITIEFLPPIQPGMKAREFLPLLKERIETASAALLSR